MRVEPHGGYVVRAQTFDAQTLAALAREALLQEGVGTTDCDLVVTYVPSRRVVRFAYDAPYTYGRRGARWYEVHHALAKLLSQATRDTVHAYVFDPDELELVASYGSGRRVGGDRLRYDEYELPSDMAELDHASFEGLKDSWPLGHLAQVLGISRAELLRLPRERSALVNLEGASADDGLSALFQLAP